MWFCCADGSSGFQIWISKTVRKSPGRPKSSKLCGGSDLLLEKKMERETEIGLHGSPRVSQGPQKAIYQKLAVWTKCNFQHSHEGDTLEGTTAPEVTLQSSSNVQILRGVKKPTINNSGKAFAVAICCVAVFIVPTGNGAGVLENGHQFYAREQSLSVH